MTTWVLDASAVMEYLRNGPYAVQVRDLIRRAEKGEAHFLISSVQLGEVVAAVTRQSGRDRALDAIEILERLGVETVGFDQEQAVAAAFLRAETGLAFADSAAAALAAIHGALVTSDVDFKRVGKKIKIHWLK